MDADNRKSRARNLKEDLKTGRKTLAEKAGQLKQTRVEKKAERKEEKDRWTAFVQRHGEAVYLNVWTHPDYRVDGKKTEKDGKIALCADGYAFLYRYGKLLTTVEYDWDEYLVVEKEHFQGGAIEKESFKVAIVAGLLRRSPGAIRGSLEARQGEADASKLVLSLQNTRTQEVTEYIVPCTLEEYLHRYRKITVNPMHHPGKR